MSGIVYLVGAGPGDPELLTVKGARCLAQAQVVVYDFLANPELLSLAPPRAEMIYVGKKGGDHSMGQEDINRLLCDLAARGRTVVRLKGGDPFVFGRGGEEASALAARGLDFQVVPGVTSAVAAPAYAGIPVTDRRHSTEVAFVTGHEDPDKPRSTVDFSALARLGSLVFLMGVKNLPLICSRLVEAGKPPDTPAAVVRWGTTARQHTVTGTLADLPGKAAAAGIKPPAVTLVGRVVELRRELNWFERLPLFGRRILVTRTRSQAGRLSGALHRLGAAVVEIPTIALAPPQDPRPLRQAARHLGSYDWCLFTSANGVSAFFQALHQVNQDARAFHGLRLAAIGPATAQALEERGLRPEVVAESFAAEGLLAALKDYDLDGRRVLLPRAAQAREVLPQTLAQWGARVEVVPAYRTVEPEGAGEKLVQALDQGLDAITFTASSTVANLMALLPPNRREQLVHLSARGELVVAAIGPITADAARRAGFTVQVEPERYTIDELVAALARYYREGE